ncbi:MAG: L,D-transpeptidase, partial [Anaerolineae bacterium]|nr:L,D-transpeptidase [Anaerolineae bacterium]
MTQNKQDAVSRRHFLRGAGAGAVVAAAGLALPSLLHPARAGTRQAVPRQVAPQPGTDELRFIQPRPVHQELWGRITATTAVRARPGLNQELLAWLAPETVLPLLETLDAEGSNPHNRLWYRVDAGYIYTSTVQPMRPYRMPETVTEIATLIDEEPGFWAEVIVPRTPARTEPSGSPYRLEDESAVYFTHSSVHRVIGIEPDLDGNQWYKIFNDKPRQEPVYVLARHVQRISEHDLAPIHPGANKRVEVDLSAQMITCYEGDVIVTQMLTSSGGEGFDTPRGDHAVVYKQPSRYMYSDPENEAFSDPNFFDLPGVPFNIFFTTMGHAIHGTYWHGDYG